jgi:hypothetical protein
MDKHNLHKLNDNIEKKQQELKAIENKLDENNNNIKLFKEIENDKNKLNELITYDEPSKKYKFQTKKILIEGNNSVSGNQIIERSGLCKATIGYCVHL